MKMVMTVVAMVIITVAGMYSILFMTTPTFSVIISCTPHRNLLNHLPIHPHFTDQVFEAQGYTACVNSLR